MALGDFHFFLGDVSAHLNQFHTVQQRLRDGSQVVCRSNEHHIRQVVVHVDVVVVERIVLFRIQHFQHRRTRVSTVVAAQFVYLIENDDRIGGLCLDEALDDTSRHGTDVGLAVSADFSLVSDTPQ